MTRRSFIQLLTGTLAAGAAITRGLQKPTEAATTFLSPSGVKTADRGLRNAGGFYTDHFYAYDPWPLRYELMDGEWVPVRHFRGRGPNVKINPAWRDAPREELAYRLV